jgi:hypothetical protein
MRYILILLLFISGAASAQFAPTSAKSKFSNGIAIGSKDTSAFSAADTMVLTIARDSVMYYKYRGVWRPIATGGNLNNYKLISDTLFNNGYTTRARTKQYGDSIAALKLNISDTAAMLAPFIQYSDTTGLYSQVVRTFGTQTVGGNKTFSNDLDINGIITGRGGGNGSTNTVFGTSALSTNTTGQLNSAFSVFALEKNNGSSNSAFGVNSLKENTTGNQNSAFGVESLKENTTGFGNTSVGTLALSANTTGSNNTAIGRESGVWSESTGIANTTGSNNTYLGYQSVGSANNNTNETIIGYRAIGNGSNTVTIGNSSVTNNYFSGRLNSAGATFTSSGSSNTVEINHSSGSGIALNITKGGNGEGLYVNKTSGSGNAATIIGTLNATTLVKSGGTSSQFLMADGSVNTSVLPSGAYLPLSGGTLTGALSGTSAGFSSSVSSGTKFISTAGNNNIVFESLSATTGYQYIQLLNTTAHTIFGIEGTSAGSLLTNGTANASVLTTVGNTDLEFGTNQIKRVTIAKTTGDVTLTGALNGTSAAFSGGASFGSNVTALGNFRATFPSDNSYYGLLSNDGALTLDAYGVGAFMNFKILGSTKVTLTNSGNLGINNNATNAKLEVVATSGEVFRADAASGAPRIVADQTRVVLGSASANVLVKTFTDNGTDALQVAGSVFASSSITAGSGLFSTDGVSVLARSANAVTDVLSIRNSNTGTSAVTRFSIGNNASANAFTLKIHSSTHSTLPNIAQIYNEFNANLELGGYGATALTLGSGGAATFSSTVSATGFIVSSDRRLKNILSRSGDMVTYTLKNDNTKQLHYGYIAQEVEKVLPTTVSTDDKGMKAVNYIEVLVKKVNDLEKKIEQLEKLLNK